MIHHSLLAACLAATLSTASLDAQGPTLLRNFNQRPVSNNYSGSSTAWAQVGSKGYITFRTEEHGNELWTYDAVTGNLAVMTEGLFPGPSTYVGNPRHQIAFNSKVYFTAWTIDYGRELYATDGTVAGTYLVKDIMPGNPEGDPFTIGPIAFTVYQGRLLFTADDGVNGRQLWQSDGTASGTVPVVPPGPVISTLVSYAPTPGGMFLANNGTLYLLTFAPNTLTAITGATVTVSGELAVIGTQAYVSADVFALVGALGWELYSSGGAGIALVRDIIPGATGSSPRKLTEFNGKLYFSAGLATTYHVTWGHERLDTELYEYDPLTGALTAHNLNNTPYTSTWYAPQITDSSYPSQFLENNNTLFFSADDGVNGNELWTVDLSGNVRMVNPGYSGGIGPFSLDASPKRLTIARNNKIIFEANDGTNGTEIWESDGSDAGTIMAGDYRPGSSGTKSIRIFSRMGAGLCLFRGNNYNGWSTELHSYQVDPTSGVAGTLTPIADVNPQAGRDGSGGFYNAEGVVDLGNGVGLFGANAEFAQGTSLGAELWRTDGVHTAIVKDIHPGASGSKLREFCQAGDLMYFQADDGAVGAELWISNGIPVGQPGHLCSLAADIKPGGSYDSGRPQHITYVGRNRVVFSAHYGSLGTGYDLGLFWASGASHGMIHRYETIGGVTTQIPCYGPESLVYHNGLVYFGAGNDDLGGLGVSDLYTTDGVVAIKRTNLEFQRRPEVVHFDDANRQIYFAGYYRDTLGANAPANTALGEQLWVVDSDFATAPVRLTNEAVVSEFGDPIGSDPSRLADLGGQLFFRGNSVTLGRELWTTDGTAAGTAVFMDINPGAADSGYEAPYVIDAGMVFAAHDGITGREMWLSNGTIAGTALIADTTPGIYPQGSGAPELMTQVGSRRVVYRYGLYSQGGSELWSCDGNAPVRTSDINPGNGDSKPDSMQVQNGKLLFEAENWQTGIEAYTINLGANVQSFGISSSPGSDTHARISCRDALLGTPYTIQGTGAIPGSACFLGVSFPAGETVISGLSIYLDPSAFMVIGQTKANTGGDFSFALPAILAHPNYAGAMLVYQALSFHPAGLWRSRLTNALQMHAETF